jgi:hypothetical protein
MAVWTLKGPQDEYCNQIVGITHVRFGSWSCKNGLRGTSVLGAKT